jgi:hypothetical protein
MSAPTTDPAALAHHRLLTRQRQVAEALADGRCTTACAGSPNRLGNCCCPCGGRHHAALWAVDLVPAEEPTGPGQPPSPRFTVNPAAQTAQTAIRGAG